MALQNRVDPFGELIATESRGTLMGNRGCLHDDARRIRRRFVGRRWIFCLLEFRGRHRQVMTPGRYTELFFLDEATALAAGHRPCAECQRERYNLFREHWRASVPGWETSLPSADEMDEVLHGERLNNQGEKRTWLTPLSELPDGVLVADHDGIPCLVLGKRLVRWEPGRICAGHVPAARGVPVQVLTPRSIVSAIAHGYPVTIHPTAGK